MARVIGVYEVWTCTQCAAQCLILLKGTGTGSPEYPLFRTIEDATLVGWSPTLCPNCRHRTARAQKKTSRAPAPCPLP